MAGARASLTSHQKNLIGCTTLADYHYLADGMRVSAHRTDGTGIQYRGSLIYTKDTDGGLELDCALTSGGRIANDAGTLQVQHFIRDHLGSVRTVVDGLMLKTPSPISGRDKSTTRMEMRNTCIIQKRIHSLTRHAVLMTCSRIRMLGKQLTKV